MERYPEWLNGLRDDHLSYIRNGGDFESRENSDIKICGICKREFVPRENSARLICYSKHCIQEYNMAKFQIEEEKRKAERQEKRLLEIKLAEEKRVKKKEEMQSLKIHERDNQLDGYVYLMKSSNGYFKIGISSDVEKRLQGIKRQFPVKIEIIHYFACSDFRKTEKYLHNKYSSKRIEYEWFQLDDDEVDWIKSITDYQLDME